MMQPEGRSPHMIVIATAPLLSELAQSDLSPDVKVFSDCDFLSALDAILTGAPRVIALDPDFVATARGAALVARVKADPRLSHSEIRAIRPGGREWLEVSAHGPDGELMEMIDLDQCGTRRAIRYTIRPEVETRINGTAGQLVNLSATGAQVLGAMRLRPTETVRLMLLDDSTELRLRGVVAWANLEIGAGGASRYRVGLDLPDADREVMQTYCLRNRA